MFICETFNLRTFVFLFAKFHYIFVCVALSSFCGTATELGFYKTGHFECGWTENLHHIFMSKSHLFKVRHSEASNNDMVISSLK